MTALKNKIDFVVLVSVKMANGNGDPLDGNRPRTDYDGYGEISDVCIKRKIRNRMQDMGYPVFVQSADRSDDGFTDLASRAKAQLDGAKSDSEKAAMACEKWLDVRTFGQVFAYKGEKKGVSIGVRGPVSIHQAVSVSPVEIESLQITKSVNGEAPKKGEDSSQGASMSSDRMGMKHFVRFGLYKIKGSINVQLAEKTGFSYDDAKVIKECLRTLFVNDASSARPDGSMQVVKVFWWEHNCKEGQYSAAKVHDSVHVSLKEGVESANKVEDYDITVEPLAGLATDVTEGF